MDTTCNACGWHGPNVELVYVRTTNGGVTFCRQCLDDINRKHPAADPVVEKVFGENREKTP